MTLISPTSEYDLLDDSVDEPPAVLWHYTDAAGFHGIISSGSLRLGNAAFLNDRTEREYGWRIINEVLDQEIAKVDHVSGFFRFVKQITAPVQLSAQIFVSSFSERHESLSQWQRYGADGNGYCLGVDVSAVLRAAEFQHVALRRLVYERRAQLTAINNLVKHVRQDLERRYPPAREEARTVMLLSRALLMLQFSELALTFKHPHFADEEEWRLILIVDQSSDPLLSRIRFAQRGAFVKPHIDLRVCEDSRPYIPVTQVVCGPRLDAPLAVAAAEYFLRAHRSNASVSSSELATTWR